MQYFVHLPEVRVLSTCVVRELDLGLLSFRAARWRRCDAGLRQLTLLLRELSAALQEAKTDDEDPYGLRPQTVLRGPSPLELTVPRRVSMLVQQRRSPRPPVARLRPEVDQPPVAVRLSTATRPPVGSSRWQEKEEQRSRVRFPGETLPWLLRVHVALDHAALASLPARSALWTAATSPRPLRDDDVGTLHLAGPGPIAKTSRSKRSAEAESAEAGAVPTWRRPVERATMLQVCVSTRGAGTMPAATPSGAKPCCASWSLAASWSSRRSTRQAIGVASSSPR